MRMHAYRQSSPARRGLLRALLRASVALAGTTARPTRLVTVLAMSAQAAVSPAQASPPPGAAPTVAQGAGPFWTPLLAGAQRGEVTVVLFSVQGCAFCEAVRREQLQPLARAGIPGYRSVDLDLADARPFRDARGHPARDASPQALARRLDVRLAPTVVFLGPDGTELAERLVGYGSRDFYGAYLESRIAQSRERLASMPR